LGRPDVLRKCKKSKRPEVAPGVVRRAPGLAPHRSGLGVDRERHVKDALEGQDHRLSERVLSLI